MELSICIECRRIHTLLGFQFENLQCCGRRQQVQGHQSAWENSRHSQAPRSRYHRRQPWRCVHLYNISDHVQLQRIHDLELTTLRLDLSSWVVPRGESNRNSLRFYHVPSHRQVSSRMTNVHSFHGPVF